MIEVSVVISLCDNREDMFKRSLDTWCKQTISKEMFEIILVDDSNRENILEICKSYNLNFQYIKIDNSKCELPITTFIPVLTNNVGFRKSRGDVIIITGPETLQSENNIKTALSMKDKKECAYGTVFLSGINFVDILRKNWHKIKDRPLKELISIKESCIDCYTIPPHPPAYWFLTVVKKEYIYKINGVDEKFGQGICGEDDDFANRMKMSGVKPVFNTDLFGIHQNHSREDDKKHSVRHEEEGKILRQRNIKLIEQNLKNKTIVANKTHKWGNESVIIEHKIF